jgi:COP9 signalosome complex subunit 3
MPAIQLLLRYILQLDRTSSTLTSTHRAVVRLCLLAQAYHEAAIILDRTTYYIPQVSDTRSLKYLSSASDQPFMFLGAGTGLSQQITGRTYLEYYFFGAMCYIGMQRYKDALFFLEIVLAAPTQQAMASQIMIEAYKKWLLVNLLTTGNVPPAPKNSSPHAMRTIKALAKPYDVIVDTYKANDAVRLRKEIEAAQDILQEDGNYGLMVEVFQAIRKYAVVKLGKTYSALSVTEVAKRVYTDSDDLSETTAYLQSLIQSGSLNATITLGTSNNPTLRFLPTTSSAQSESAIELALSTRTQELQSLLSHIQDTEHRLEISKEYVDFLKKLKKAKEEEKKATASANAPNVGGVGPGMSMPGGLPMGGKPSGLDDDDDDEDMMEGEY